jgi:Na+-transporting methylmalonyl-CoA/oxaloacetate decarboxylase gamma subunit
MNELFLQSLRIMGLGMAGIFAVVAIFYLTIVALGKFLPPEKE